MPDRLEPDDGTVNFVVCMAHAERLGLASFTVTEKGRLDVTVSAAALQILETKGYDLSEFSNDMVWDWHWDRPIANLLATVLRAAADLPLPEERLGVSARPAREQSFLSTD